MFIINVWLLIMGHFINAGFVSLIKCSVHDPFKWKSCNFFGNIFEMSHIGIIIVSSVKAERIFYGIPYYEGFFNSNIKINKIN
jgi:hypothetical protein